MSHTCHRFWKCHKTLTLCSLLTRVHNPLRLPRETTSERPKVAQTCNAFNILTSKWASRHNGVHFFDIATSKSGPNLVCFVHFDLEMCFAPQRRALFPHLNCQKCPNVRCFVNFDFNCASRHNSVHFFDIATSKSGPELVCFLHFDFEMCFAPQRRHRSFERWSGAGAFCTFWLGNVLRATTACNFSSLIWPPAALASLLFDPLEPQIIEKAHCFASRLSYLFGHLDLLSSETFSSLIFSLLLFSLLFSLLLFSSRFFCSTSAFHLSILSEVWLPNFLRKVGSRLILFDFFAVRCPIPMIGFCDFLWINHPNLKNQVHFEIL